MYGKPDNAVYSLLLESRNSIIFLFSGNFPTTNTIFSSIFGWLFDNSIFQNILHKNCQKSYFFTYQNNIYINKLCRIACIRTLLTILFAI